MTPIERHIVDAFASEHAGVEMWTIRTRNPADPDAPDYCYLLPSITFENLAVEYGLPEDDIDELLRVAILQLHVPSHLDAPAAAQGLMRDGRPVTLGTADSTRQAREAHLARIAWVEANRVRIVAPNPSTARMVQALDADEPAEVAVDPAERLRALKASYRPDATRMKQRRADLQRLLGREV
ncbi:hypothetical protein [Streptosporangium canum]|uniref:hypothetical protein n=1 Tax=Streptosporangium canum TaxID=324952 RepID=UPI0037B81449